MDKTNEEESISSLEKEAIKASSQGVWNIAIDLNHQILKFRPENIPALNRLARALWEKGEHHQAKKIYQKSLTIDPFNLIASKNLQRLNDHKTSVKLKNNPAKSVNKAIFLEEPGRTKVVKLVRIASVHALSTVDCADEVYLIPKKRLVCIETCDQTYLGSLPEDLSYRLLRLIKAGNRYHAFVKVVDRKNLEIFIREVKRASKYQSHPSFPARLSKNDKSSEGSLAG